MKKRRMYKIGEKPRKVRCTVKRKKKKVLIDYDNYIDPTSMTKKTRIYYGLYTEYGVCIDLLITDGLTHFFSSKLEAMTYASATRTYHYEVLNGKKQFAGYAVPK